MPALLDVEGLEVRLPDGTPVLTAASLSLDPGRVLTVLGPSGAGKTTFLRALLHPDQLRHDGFEVRWDRRVIDAEPAFVPQRGALFDHLDVAGNITLAQRAAGLAPDAKPWLRAVGLDPAWADTPRRVTALSGGQAQRLAVVRALSAGRRILVLDEPTVGLDAVAVTSIAARIVEQARTHEAAVVIITHDLEFAASVSDDVVFLDPAEARLREVVPGWRLDDREARTAELHKAVRALLEGASAPRALAQPMRRGRSADLLAPLRIAGQALSHGFRPHLARESLVVLRLALLQALARPALFYAIVGLLLGITVPYVMVHISPSLRPSAVLGLIGGSHILSLAPPLSAIVFAATSGSAINAWLGGLRLHGQVLALEGLGISPPRYLFAPAWLALALGYLATFVLFVASMTAGGYLLFAHYDVPHALSKLTADFLDPSDARLPYLVRALWLVASYAVGVASIVVARGSAPKSSSAQVTRAMTASVMQSTLLVVALELATVSLLFAWTGGER